MAEGFPPASNSWFGTEEFEGESESERERERASEGKREGE